MFSIQPLYSITIYYCFYPISFIRFFAYINHTYIVYFAEVSGFFISAFISIYSLNTLFTEINSSCLIYESIKALEIRTSIVSNLPFPSKIFCYASSFFFLITGLSFLIPAFITQIFTAAAERAIRTGIPTKEAYAEIETEPVTVDAKISKCSV